MQQKKYENLHTLLEQEPKARRYFETLPDYVRDMMTQRAGGVNSMESLQHYADNLLAGDH